MNDCNDANTTAAGPETHQANELALAVRGSRRSKPLERRLDALSPFKSTPNASHGSHRSTPSPCAFHREASLLRSLLLGGAHLLEGALALSERRRCPVRCKMGSVSARAQLGEGCRVDGVGLRMNGR